MATHDELFEQACDTTLAVYTKFGCVDPIVLSFRDGEIAGVTECSKFMPHYKEALASALSGTLKQLKCDAYVFATEAWMVEYTGEATKDAYDENGNLKVMPRDHPKRIEVLHVQFETKEYHRSRAYSIAKGQILGIWQEADSRKDKSERGGTFSGLLS